MNVLFVAQCSGKALTETRRILDQFAERCGDRVWQTPITREGLDVVHALLRKSARKNTAVVCRWIHGRDHSEILWIVGDRSRFNPSGAVPTGVSLRVTVPEENDWRTGEGCLLLVAMAALWHDLGKCSCVFQETLRGRARSTGALRHEWISLRLFQAFVGQAGTDREWLERLAALEDRPLSATGARGWLKSLVKDGLSKTCASAFPRLPPLARAIGWLVLGHHRLPVNTRSASPVKAAALEWTLDNVNVCWGYMRESDPPALRLVWRVNSGDLPVASRAWRKRTGAVARKMLARPDIVGTDWLGNPYALHVARLGLMLGDHVYSSLTEPRARCRGDDAYALYANTHEKRLNQKLDEHLIGVERTASSIIWTLGALKAKLPSLGPRKEFRKRSADERFRWQDKAFELASGLAEQSAEQGFFGLNMASTGFGKTLANGRICSALAGPGGARFTLALGLRTLTLQTGDVYREKLGLGPVDLAVLAGDQAVRDLHDVGWDEADAEAEAAGTEARMPFFPHGADVHYEGSLCGPLQRWLGAVPKAAALISAPVLACTIDHLVPATDGLRGGSQIAPMLRLMTSDLVLDEPDDFDVEDLYALTRLVTWAGMLGSRVLLSSATIPPALARGLFAAYAQGRAIYRMNRGTERPLPIPCAWFDEFGCHATQVNDPEAFEVSHRQRMEKRVRRLETQVQRRKAVIIPVEGCPSDQAGRLNFWAERILTSAVELHAAHAIPDPVSGKRLSFGIVRMAHIDPLIDTAIRLLELGAGEGRHIHLCCYHSRFPLLMRSALEARLDKLLTRNGPGDFMLRPEVRRLLDRSPAQEHIVLILATSVAEVGRDHDYDWAIVEPSSMRSLIQLLGRILRHRQSLIPAVPNIHLLDQNLKGLASGPDIPVFCRPGFERKLFPLASHHLRDLLTAEQMERLDARARILERPSLTPENNLADREHDLLREVMLGSVTPIRIDCVNRWWIRNATLSGEVQRASPFRKESAQETFAWLPEEDGESGCALYSLDPKKQPVSRNHMCGRFEFSTGNGISFLPMKRYRERLDDLAARKNMDVRTCAERFGRVLLARDAEQGWLYHDFLGFRRRD